MAADLDALQWVADPHADAAIEAATRGADTEERLRRIDAMNGVIREWQDNAGVAAWRPGLSVPSPEGSTPTSFTSASFRKAVNMPMALEPPPTQAVT